MPELQASLALTWSGEMSSAMTDGRCSPVVVPCPQSRSEKEEERKNPEEEFDEGSATVRHYYQVVSFLQRHRPSTCFQLERHLLQPPVCDAVPPKGLLRR